MVKFDLVDKSIIYIGTYKELEKMISRIQKKSSKKRTNIMLNIGPFFMPEENDILGIKIIHKNNNLDIYIINNHIDILSCICNQTYNTVQTKEIKIDI